MSSIIIAHEAESDEDMWDAGQYLRFGGERARPFFDLVAQVGATDPRYVADLGCGPGNLTAALARALAGRDGGRRGQLPGDDRRRDRGHGAPAAAAGNLSFALGDVWDWRPERPLDVLVCNAVLQWVPGTTSCCCAGRTCSPRAAGSPSSCRATSTSRATRSSQEMARSPRWRALLADARLNRQAGDPADYVALLARPGFEVDAWETSYLHILHGENPVLEWTKGSTLRPVLAALDAEQADGVRRASTGNGCGEAYHPHSFGTIFPFRRVFTVVHRADPGRG